MKTFALSMMSLSFPIMLIGVWFHFDGDFNTLAIAAIVFCISTIGFIVDSFMDY